MECLVRWWCIVHVMISSFIEIDGTDSGFWSSDYGNLFDGAQTENHTTSYDWRDVANKHCPYYSICNNRSTTESSTDRSLISGSCCQPCDCSISCRTRNCCPGVLRNGSSIRCQGQYELFNKHRGLQEVDRGHYYVVDTCGESFNDTDIVEGCSQPKDLLDYIMVIDMNTNRVYKNEKCALCNHITEYVHWELVAVVNETWLSLDFQALTDRVLSEAIVYSRPTSSMDAYSVDINRCFPGSIGACNQTGLWDVYDLDLEEACIQSPQTVYYGRFVYFDVLYSNVYCYLCNQRSAAVHGDSNTCPPVEEFFYYPGTYEKELRAVIDGEQVSRLLLEDSRNVSCNSREVFDDVMMRCRVLTCPFGSVAVYGACDSKIMYTEGLALDLTIRLNAATENKHGTGRLHYRNLLNSVLKKYGLDTKGSNCVICEQRFYTRHNESSPLYLDLSLMTGTNCSASDIIAGLTSANGTQQRRNLVFDADDAENQTTLYYKRAVEQFCSLNTHVPLQPRFYCPSVQLTEDDIVKIGDAFGDEVVGKILGSSDVVSEVPMFGNMSGINSSLATDLESWRLCIADYVDAFKPSGLTSHGFRLEIGSVSIAVLVVLLFLF